MLLAEESQFIEDQLMEMPELDEFIMTDEQYLEDTLRVDALVKEYPNLD